VADKLLQASRISEGTAITGLSKSQVTYMLVVSSVLCKHQGNLKLLLFPLSVAQ